MLSWNAKLSITPDCRSRHAGRRVTRLNPPASNRAAQRQTAPRADALPQTARKGLSLAFSRPATLVEVAEAAKAGEDSYRVALAGFLDRFYMNPAWRQGMIDAKPPVTEIAITDAYIGAVGEHLARRWGLAVPSWTADPRRTLRSPVFAGGIEALKAMLLAQSPLAFRKRMIFVEHEPLRRARMPLAPMPSERPQGLPPG